MPDYAVRQQIAELQQRMYSRDSRDSYDPGLVFTGNEAQYEALCHEVEQLEDQNGFVLDTEDFARAVVMAHELGGEADRAFNVVLAQVQQEDAEWHNEFKQQVSEFEGEWGRKLTPSELRKLHEAHEDVGPVDVRGAFTRLWGRSDPELKDALTEAEARRDAIARQLEDHESKAPGKGDNAVYTEGYARQHAETLAELQRTLAERERAVTQAAEPLKGEIGSAGVGDFDPDSGDSGRVAYMVALAEQPAELKTVDDFDLDTTDGKAEFYAAAARGHIVKQDDGPPDEVGSRVESALSHEEPLSAEGVE